MLKKAVSIHTYCLFLGLNCALIPKMLGQYEEALEMLELASKANDVSPDETTFLEYKPLRSNPRFIAIREKMGLPPLEP